MIRVAAVGDVHVDADVVGRYRPALDKLPEVADVLLIAPLDANTLAKLALGLTDNCLTCVYRAWDPARPVILAPAMNTLMWEHPAMARHLAQVTADLRGALRVVPPISKKLACDDVGLGAMAERAEILAQLLP